MSAEKLREALIKKAVGFTVSEVTKEYAVDENGDKRVIKEKEAVKFVPPDTAALKTLLELEGVKNEFDGMSDEDLEKERQRLIAEISKPVKKTGKRRQSPSS